MLERASGGSKTSAGRGESYQPAYRAAAHLCALPHKSRTSIMIFNLPAIQGRVPLHVLIVVVGGDQDGPLEGVDIFCRDIFRFWRRRDEMLGLNLAVRTIGVLAGDKNGAITIEHDQGSSPATEPTFDHVCEAIRGWCDQIAAGGAGVIHWIGHGQMLMQDAGIQNLFTQDRTDQNVRRAISWTKTINQINQHTKGHPVFCFIDCCRTYPAGGPPRNYPGVFHEYDEEMPRSNAMVMFGASPSDSSLWDDRVHVDNELAAAGFSGGALATRAFLKCLESVGAQYYPAQERYEILMHELGLGSQHLVRRWARHIGPDAAQGSDAMPDLEHKGEHSPLMFTKNPESVVDVHAGPAAKTCLVKRHDSADALHGFRQDRCFEFLLPRGEYHLEVDDGSGGVKVSNHSVWRPYEEFGSPP